MKTTLRPTTGPSSNCGDGDLGKNSFKAFTLVELLVSMVILMVIVLISVSVITQTQKVWLQGSARIEQFREARMAFETITQNLRQATLNTYTTYRYSNGTTIPTVATDAPITYVRQSELQFVTGRASSILDGTSANGAPGHAVFFQAPLGVSSRAGYEGLKNLLCGRGYFVSFGNDAGWKPSHVPTSRNRFRMMEFRPPAEQNKVYSVSPGAWFRDAFTQGVTSSETVSTPAFTRPAAENIIALIISPRVAPEDISTPGTPTTWIAPSYNYDSSTMGAGNTTTQGTQHMLPPIVQVTLVAIDEVSARKLEEQYGSSPPPLLQAGAFNSAASYESDLATLENQLVSLKVAYRVFTTAVALRNAKWNLL